MSQGEEEPAIADTSPELVTQTGKRKASPIQEDVTSPKRSKRVFDDEPDPSDASKEYRATMYDETPVELVKPAAGDGRKKAELEEKRRGKRLFGGLLNTLSQTNVSSNQKRRREIELRQQDKLQQQRAEDDRKRHSRSAKIEQLRIRELIYFEEKVMKTKHENMLQKARCLKTKAMPTIFYRPWKLSREDEDTIDDQLYDVKAKIEREVEEFNIKREEHVALHGRGFLYEKTMAERDAKSPADHARAGSPPRDSIDTNVPPVSGSRLAVEKDVHDETGDVVVEDEDTVIY